MQNVLTGVEYNKSVVERWAKTKTLSPVLWSRKIIGCKAENKPFLLTHENWADLCVYALTQKQPFDR